MKLVWVAVSALFLTACMPAPSPGQTEGVVSAEGPETVVAVDAHLKRANEALAARDFERAFVALDLARELSPRSPRVQLARQRALLLRAAARPQMVTAEAAPALRYASDVVAEDATFGPSTEAARHVVAARLAALANAGATVVGEVEAALRADPKSVDALLMKAQLARAAKDAAGAMAAYEAAVAVAPEDVTALNNAAVAYLELGRAADALGLLTRALKLKDTAPTRINAADALLRLGKRGEAAEQLKRAVALAPEEALPLRQLGALLQGTGDLDGAAAALEKARALAPDAWTSFNLGVVRQAQKRDADAVPLFVEAMKADPKAYAPAYHLAVSLQRLGDTAGAATALRRYLARSEGVEAEAQHRADAQRLLEEQPVTPPPREPSSADPLDGSPSPSPARPPRPVAPGEDPYQAL